MAESNHYKCLTNRGTARPIPSLMSGPARAMLGARTRHLLEAFGAEHRVAVVVVVGGGALGFRWEGVVT